MKKTIFYLLLILNLLLPLTIISNTLDGDLGWHLRFGQKLHTGNFPYLDTYTYSKHGNPWTNHEWGGDWLFWLIYSNLGYFGLVIITSLAITLAFLIIGQTFFHKITSIFLTISLVCQWTITHILVARLAMFTALFAALIIYLLERSKNNDKFLYIIAPVLYLWSVLHGSWILGFIIINIYLVTAVTNKVIPIKYQFWLKEKSWTNNFIYKIIFIQLLASGLIIINPYGIKIWQEIIGYFGQNYYKAHITEWVPSYTFPIFWKILILQTIALVFVIYGFSKKQINLTHLLLFIAFYYVAITYKRQGLLIGLLSAPVLYGTIDNASKIFNAKNRFQNNLNKKIIYFFLIITLIILSLNYLLKIHYSPDIWADKIVAKNNSFPYEAVTWLKTNTKSNLKIFNEFSWGGYLNWTVPYDLVYFDGRGAATWRYDNRRTLLEHYFEILDKSEGLKEIENDGADLVFLRRANFIPLAKPDVVNNWFFGDSYLKNYIEKNQLEKNLDESKNWQKIYTDKQANIWQNLNRAPK
jgi:hypothetical protein